MTKEELEQQLKEIDDKYTPEERMNILREIGGVLKKTNVALRLVQDEIEEGIDKEKSRKLQMKLSTSGTVEI